MDLETDILIVGGGIGGTVLAELLARGGKRVLIVERNAGPPPFLRPEVLWPAAVQTLFSLRDRASWEEDSLRPVGGIVLDRGGRLATVVTPEKLRAAGIQPYFENPNQTREMLLAQCQAEVRRGVEVTEVLREDGVIRGVEARQGATGKTMRISAGLTVGDDGADSIIRTACGIGIELQPFPADFFVGGLPWPALWAPDVAHILVPPSHDKSGLLAVGFVPVPRDQAATVAVVRAAGATDSAALGRAWKATLAAAASAPPELHAADFPAQFTRIGRRWGHAERYGAPGAVLLGDALHPVSPAGGQGANMAIADAVALARLILAGTPDLVRAYEAARRAPNQRGLRPTRLAARFFGIQANSLVSDIARFVLPGLPGIPGLVTTMLRTLAQGSANPP